MRPGESVQSWLTGALGEARPDNDRREARLLGLAFAFLIATGLSIAIAPAARSGVWSDSLTRWQHLAALPIWAACAWLVRRVLRRKRPQRDPFLLPCALLLTGWGLLVIWRLSPAFGARQAGWLLVACVALVELLRAPHDLRWLRRYRYLWLLAGIILVVLTLGFGTNPSGGEPRLWLGCCGLYFQPSEPLRLLLIAYMASYLADRTVLQQEKSLAGLLPLLAPLLLVWALSVALLGVQHDLGTGTLFLMLLAVLLYIASDRWEVLAFAGLAAILGSILGFSAFDVVRLRILAWLDPWADPTGGSYQIVQSLIAIASGGIFGQGAGLGSPGFVPIAHSDFIFASVAEEWGLAGSLAMIGLGVFLTTRGLRVALRCRDRYGAMLAAGLSVAFGLQSFLIIGGVTRMLPLTGVTLPFVSYGGSSLVTSFLGLGFLLVLSGEEGAGRTITRPLTNVQAALTALGIGLALVVGWWSLYRAPVLTARTDNPRRSLAERFARRGAILDRQGAPLAFSQGERGSYTRVYTAPAASLVTGYDSPRYGQTGIESSMDGILRGEQGRDPLIALWQQLSTGAPVEGLDVRLALDLSRQRAAAEALGDKVGAVVIMEARSGALLALASSPSFDPNVLDEDWPTLVTRTDAPLLNRATQARYQPGLALAPFVAAWAEKLALVDPQTTFDNMTRPVNVDGHPLECAGVVETGSNPTLGAALRAGCPSPIVDLGLILGGPALSEMISAFGFDETSPIRLESPLSTSGATPATTSEIRLSAVGQGTLLVSPLQMARAFGALLNDGLLPALLLVEAFRRPDGEWESVPAIDVPVRVLESAVNRSLVGAMTSRGSDLIRVSAWSLSGPGEERIAWYLVGRLSDSPVRVVVVALEGGTPGEAEQVGLSLLR